jgi:hypothetical protein
MRASPMQTCPTSISSGRWGTPRPASSIPGCRTPQGNFESGLQTWNTRYGAPANRSFGIVSEFPGPDNGWPAPKLGIAALAEGVGNPVIVRIGYDNRANVTVGAGRRTAARC